MSMTSPVAKANPYAGLVAAFQGRVKFGQTVAQVITRKRSQVVLGDSTQGRAALMPGKAVRASRRYSVG